MKSAIILLSLLFSYEAQSQIKCRNAAELNARQIEKIADKSLSDVPETFFIPGQVVVNGHELKSAYTMKQLESVYRRKKIGDVPHLGLGIATQSVEDGGGALHLVRLEGREDEEYNHRDLKALFNLNPALANLLGFYRVPGHYSEVWVPDAQQLNYRIDKLSKMFGFSKAAFNFESTHGLIKDKEYLELLANGKFPFASFEVGSDHSLSSHDAIHGFAFAVLNATQGGRIVLKAATRRNQAVLNIINRLESEISGSGQDLSKVMLSKAGNLSTNGMELTILLSIILSGNYGYRSATPAFYQNLYSGSRIAPSPLREGQLHYLKQDINLHRQRIANLLTLYTNGSINFSEALQEVLLKATSEFEIQKVRKIFQEEVVKLKRPSTEIIVRSADEILRFIPRNLFDQTVGSVSASQEVGVFYSRGSPYPVANGDESWIFSP